MRTPQSQKDGRPGTLTVVATREFYVMRATGAQLSQVVQYNAADVKAVLRQQLLEPGCCSSSAGACAAWPLLAAPHMHTAARHCVGTSTGRRSAATPLPLQPTQQADADIQTHHSAQHVPWCGSQGSHGREHTASFLSQHTSPAKATTSAKHQTAPHVKRAM